MPRVRVWQPLAVESLPAGLQSSLRVANMTPRRNWAVCQMVTVDMPGASHAEILRLREEIALLEKRLAILEGR